MNYGPYTPVVFVLGEGILANEGVEWGGGKGYREVFFKGLG